MGSCDLHPSLFRRVPALELLSNKCTAFIQKKVNIYTAKLFISGHGVNPFLPLRNPKVLITKRTLMIRHVESIIWSCP